MTTTHQHRQAITKHNEILSAGWQYSVPPGNIRCVVYSVKDDTSSAYLLPQGGTECYWMHLPDIDPEMSALAKAHDLSHWQCTRHSTAEEWIRTGGQVCVLNGDDDWIDTLKTAELNKPMIMQPVHTESTKKCWCTYRQKDVYRDGLLVWTFPRLEDSEPATDLELNSFISPPKDWTLALTETMTIICDHASGAKTEFTPDHWLWTRQTTAQLFEHLTSKQCPSMSGQIEIISGAFSSPCPPLHLIPRESLVRLAERFSLGEARKGDKAWNALSENQDILLSKKFLINRLEHGMHHCMKLMEKIAHDLPLTDDDDAAAIMWAGAFACAATAAQQKKGATP